ncbi:MAG: glycosyltransferase family 9 protein [Chthoniobacterales bacterium]
MAGRILIIRGGAIGDFILTLPAIRLLRQTFPDAYIEVLGYRHITTLAKGIYVDATRSIEYSAMAGFFNPKSELDSELCAYFSGFQQIISYLYDPDGFFEGNLRRAGVTNLVSGTPILHEDFHASIQLAEPLKRLGLYLTSEDLPAPLTPADTESAEAGKLLQAISSPRLAIHPGSGGRRKNWPAEKWTKWITRFTDTHPAWNLLILGGESDQEALQTLRKHPHSSRLHFLENKDLPVLAAVLHQCQGYMGHDSGISHLAAAAGCPCVLLFGPTKPEVWGPLGKQVCIIKSPTESMADISPEEVTSAVDSFIVSRIS